KDLQRHLVERGWIDRAVIHVADEPIVENVDSSRALSRRVHAAAPRLQRIEAIQAPDFGRDLEIWVVELSFLERWYDSYRARQQAGNMELWCYTSWLPQGACPKRLIGYPLSETRLIPLLAALAALRAVIPSFTTYPRDPAVLLAARRQALLALARPPH